MEGLCECGDESPGSIKCWEVLEWRHNWRLLEKGSAPRVSEWVNRQACHPQGALRDILEVDRVTCLLLWHLFVAEELTGLFNRHYFVLFGKCCRHCCFEISPANTEGSKKMYSLAISWENIILHYRARIVTTCHFVPKILIHFLDPSV
jgi:hypothetical protein